MTTATLPAVDQMVAAAVAALPLPQRVTPADAVAPAAAPLPDGPAAVRLRLAGQVNGSVALVVGADVVTALQESPMGALDLVGALQPALVAAVTAAGPGAAGEAEQVDPAALVAQFAGDTGAVAVPLLDAGRVHAVLFFSIGSAGAASPAPRSPLSSESLNLLADVQMSVTVEIGRTRLAVRDLLSLAPGAVVELDRAAGSPADLLVNGRMIARGEIVVVDEDYALRITEIVNGGDQQS